MCSEDPSNPDIVGFECEGDGTQGVQAGLIFVRTILFAVALGVVASLILPRQAVAEDWPIKSFQVVAVEPSGITDDHALLYRVIEDFVRNHRNDLIDLDFTSLIQTIEPSAARDILVRDIQIALIRSAEWMESQGFSPPRLEPVVRLEDGTEAYRVYLVRGMESIAGIYHGNTCDEGLRNERVIRLDYDDIQDNGSLTWRGKAVAAHELFHAVQYGSPFFQNCNNDAIGSWITEGTAKAMGWHMAKELSPRDVRDALEDSLTGTRIRGSLWGLRNYSNPLPVPADMSEPIPSPVAYATSSFWTYLAEYYGTQGHPKTPGWNRQTSDYSFAYLVKFFGVAADRDCNTVGASCKSEIEWLDSQLRLNFGKPLRDLYAEFGAAFALYGYWRLQDNPIWDEFWVEGAFSPGCATVSLGSDDGNLQIIEEVRQFEPLSMLCWEVQLNGFDAEKLPVMITAEMRSSAWRPTLNQLTSAIAEGKTRPAKADTQFVTGERQKTTWEYEIPVVQDDDRGKGTLFLLTNVADDAEYTARYSIRDNTDFTLTFTVVREYAQMGASTVDGGSIADAIDTPLPLEFEQYRAHVFPGQNRKVGETYVGTGYADGLDEPCIMHIAAVRKSNAGALTPSDLIDIYIQTSGPFKPGEYPIIDGTGMRGPQDAPPGFVVAGVFLSELPPPRHDMAFTSGTLRIDSVRGTLLTGRLTGTAINSEFLEGNGDTRTLSFAFSMKVRAPVGMYSSNPYACLASR
jgi:hypothetical protein